MFMGQKHHMCSRAGNGPRFSTVQVSKLFIPKIAWRFVGPSEQGSCLEQCYAMKIVDFQSTFIDFII